MARRYDKTIAWHGKAWHGMAWALSLVLSRPVNSLPGGPGAVGQKREHAVKDRTNQGAMKKAAL